MTVYMYACKDIVVVATNNGSTYILYIHTYIHTYIPDSALLLPVSEVVVVELELSASLYSVMVPEVRIGMLFPPANIISGACPHTSPELVYGSIYTYIHTYINLRSCWHS